MPNASQRQGPLDHLGLAARTNADKDGGIELGTRSFVSIIELRATWTDAFASALERIVGVRPPQKSPGVGTADELNVFWMGPDRWWLVGSDSQLPTVNELRQNLAAFGAAATEIGEAFAVLTLSGDRARDVLAKGCTIDLHPSVFQPVCVIQTNLAKAQVALYHPSATDFHIFVRRSFTEYLWTWLEDASLEFGVRIETT